MTRYPLYFRFDDLVLGAGFVASVRLCGQVTAEVEAAGVWLNGVHPGAIAETGPDIDAAFVAFRAGLRLALIDAATEAPSFKAFKAAVERFFRECDAESEAEWAEARRQVRCGATEATPPLPRVTADKPPRIQVTLLALQPSENLAERGESRPQIAA